MTLRFFNVFVSDILPLFLQQTREIRRVRASEKRAEKVMYPFIPGVPELVESLVETDGEQEGASEDAGDEDAWQGEREFS